jgi:hypothetical protein
MRTLGTCAAATIWSYGSSSDRDLRLPQVPFLRVRSMVTANVIPVLWLCGPSGVGKTTVGWEMYAQLVVAGIGAGYVDIDQLGIHYPEPASDPARHKLKARNLNALVAGFRAAGARCVVVSGVVDNARGPQIDDIARARLTVCRLRADSAQLQQRFVGCRKSVEGGEAVLREAEDLDASTFADVCIDTTGLSAHEVARHVSERTGGWPYPPVSSFSRAVTNPTGHAGSTDQGLILWLCGLTGVGNPTVGFRVYTKLFGRG